MSRKNQQLRGRSGEQRKAAPHREEGTVEGLRIVGGQFRRRRLAYHGDRRTRPMKDRVREALFNLLGPNVKDKIVVDLFAGTGALALEAISRGADRAILIERHFPTAALIQKNVAALGVEGRAEVVASDAFFWAREASGLGPRPWLVFCSPPYDFYVERHAEMLTLLGDLMRRAPVGSLFAVEADERFNFRELPDADAWDVRAYPPAVVGIHRKGVSPGSTEAAPS